MMYCHIPASTDAEVVTFGNDVYDTFIVPEFVDGFRCAIGASIIYDDEVEIKICFLFQYTMDGIRNSSLSVANRDND